jgi:predicted MFS family arabinose efflux permease
LNTIAFSVTRTLGPALAGVLIAAIGPAWNFAIQGVMYIGVGASVMRVRVKARPAKASRASAWRSMSGGLRFAATHPVARMMMILGIVPPLLLIPSLSALMPVFAADVFVTGPEGLGLLLSAVGAGGIVGGILAATLSRYDRVGRMQSISLLIFAASLIGFALSPNMAAAVVCLLIAGTAEMVLASSTHTTLQMCAPEAMRGQVTSLLPMFPAFISVGSLAAGIGAQLLGAPQLVIVMAITAGIVWALAWTRSAALRELRMSRLVARA